MKNDEIIDANEAQLLGAMGLADGETPFPDYVAYTGKTLPEDETVRAVSYTHLPSPRD